MRLADLFSDGWAPKDAPLQQAIPRSKLVNEVSAECCGLEETLADLPPQILQSGHAIDIFPAEASKRDVVAKLRQSV